MSLMRKEREKKGRTHGEGALLPGLTTAKVPSPLTAVHRSTYGKSGASSSAQQPSSLSSDGARCLKRYASRFRRPTLPHSYSTAEFCVP